VRNFYRKLGFLASNYAKSLMLDIQERLERLKEDFVSDMPEIYSTMDYFDFHYNCTLEGNTYYLVTVEFREDLPQSYREQVLEKIHEIDGVKIEVYTKIPFSNEEMHLALGILQRQLESNNEYLKAYISGMCPAREGLKVNVLVSEDQLPIGYIPESIEIDRGADKLRVPVYKQLSGRARVLKSK